jgi:hypothetical protein
VLLFRRCLCARVCTCGWPFILFYFRIVFPVWSLLFFLVCKVTKKLSKRASCQVV